MSSSASKIICLGISHLDFPGIWGTPWPHDVHPYQRHDQLFWAKVYYCLALLGSYCLVMAKEASWRSSSVINSEGDVKGWDNEGSRFCHLTTVTFTLLHSYSSTVSPSLLPSSSLNSNETPIHLPGWRISLRQMTQMSWSQLSISNH